MAAAIFSMHIEGNGVDSKVTGFRIRKQMYLSALYSSLYIPLHSAAKVFEHGGSPLHRQGTSVSRAVRKLGRKLR